MQRSTMIAVTVFGILLVVAGYVLTRKPERGILRVSFAGLQASTLDRIVISGGHPIELKKDGAAWRLPSGREADGGMIQNLLNSTLRISSSDVLTQDPNRAAEFETDETKGEHVQLYALGTKMADFVVGKPQGSGVALRAGDVTFRVANVFTAAFAHSVSDWTQRQLFADKMDDVKRLNVRLYGDKPYTLVRGEKGWELAQDANGEALPSDFRFDPGVAQGLVSAVLNLRAQEILDADPGLAVTKLDDNADVFTLWLRDAAITTDPNGAKDVNRVVRVGAPKDDKLVYARVEGRQDVYLMPSYAIASVRKSMLDLRDLTIVLPFDADKVTAMIINDGKRALAFSKDGDGWRLPKGEKTPVGFQLDPMKVSRRIQMLAHARALGLARAQAPKAAGLSPAKASISLNAGGAPVTVEFGNKASEQDNSVYALGTDHKVYYLATYLRDTLLGGLDTFKKDAEQADPLAHLDPKTLAGLPPDVRAGLEQQIAQKKREQEMLRVINKGQAQHP